MIATATLLLGLLCSAAAAEPVGPRITVEVTDGRGKLLAELPTSDNPCTDAKDVRHVFMAHGRPFSLDLSCQDGVLEMVLSEFVYTSGHLEKVNITSRRSNEVGPPLVHTASRDERARKQTVLRLEKD